MGLQIEKLVSQFRREFEERQRRNPAYSMRAFSRDTKISQATISKIFNQKSKPSLKTVNMLLERYQSEAEVDVPIQNGSDPISKDAKLASPMIELEVRCEDSRTVIQGLRQSGYNVRVLERSDSAQEIKVRLEIKS